MGALILIRRMKNTHNRNVPRGYFGYCRASLDMEKTAILPIVFRKLKNLSSNLPRYVQIARFISFFT